MTLRFLKTLKKSSFVLATFFVCASGDLGAVNQTQSSLSLTQKLEVGDWRDVDFECYERMRKHTTDVEAIVVQARLESYKGRVENAITFCNWALLFRPNYALALYLRGVLLSDIGKVESGKMDLKLFLRLTEFAKTPYVLYLRARAFSYLDDYTGAKRQEDLVLKTTELETAEIDLLSRAYVLLNRENWKDAEAILTKLSKNNQHSPLILGHLAYCHSRTGKVELALKEFESVATIAPSFTANFAAWGTAFELQQKYGEAISKYSTALEFDESNVYALRRRGVCYSEIEEYSAGIRDLNKAVKLAPNSNIVLLDRAFVYKQNGFFKEAIADCNQVLTKNPKNATAWYQLACAKASMKDLNGAKLASEKALKLSPKYLAALCKHASIVSEMGDHKAALAEYDMAVKINPKCPDVYFSRGLLFRDEKQYAKSIIDLSKAVELEPKDALNFCALGCAEVRNQDYKKAIADCTKSIQLNSKRGHPYFSRGEAYLALGKYELALTDFTSAIGTYASYTEAFEKRAETYNKLKKPDLAKRDLEKAKQLRLAEKD